MDIKLDNKQYKFVCELLWGGSPVDRSWAGDGLTEEDEKRFRAHYGLKEPNKK